MRLMIEGKKKKTEVIDLSPSPNLITLQSLCEYIQIHLERMQSNHHQSKIDIIHINIHSFPKLHDKQY